MGILWRIGVDTSLRHQIKSLIIESNLYLSGSSDKSFKKLSEYMLRKNLGQDLTDDDINTFYSISTDAGDIITIILYHYDETYFSINGIDRTLSAIKDTYSKYCPAYIESTKKIYFVIRKLNEYYGKHINIGAIERAAELFVNGIIDEKDSEVRRAIEYMTNVFLDQDDLKMVSKEIIGQILLDDIDGAANALLYYLGDCPDANISIKNCLAYAKSGDAEEAWEHAKRAFLAVKRGNVPSSGVNSFRSSPALLSVRLPRRLTIPCDPPA